MLIDAGLIAGGDMTPEAALSKLSYVLAKRHLDLNAKKKVFSYVSVDLTQKTFYRSNEKMKLSCVLCV